MSSFNSNQIVKDKIHFDAKRLLLWAAHLPIMGNLIILG